MSGHVTATVAIALRTWRKTLRRPVVLSFSLLQPLIWMGLFGFLFSRYRLPAGATELRYLDYLAPGVCGMTVLFGATQSGVTWIRDLQTGFLARLLRAPAGGAPVLTGKLLADLVRLLVQAGIVLAAAAALGADLRPSATGVLVAGIGLTAFGAAMVSLSTTVALVARAPEPMATFVHLINMPLLFTSTALVPAAQMPHWLAAVARLNPLSWAVDAWRGAWIAGTPPAGDRIVLLVVLAIVLHLVARRQLRRVATLA